jgi:hypothetical protein
VCHPTARVTRCVGRLLAEVLQVSLPKHITTFVVEPFVDKYKIVIEAHGDDVFIIITWCVLIKREFFVV